MRVLSEMRETTLEPVVILALLSEMWGPKLEPLAAGPAACRRRLRCRGHHPRPRGRGRGRHGCHGRRREWRLMREAKLESDVALLSEMMHETKLEPADVALMDDTKLEPDVALVLVSEMHGHMTKLEPDVVLLSEMMHETKLEPADVALMDETKLEPDVALVLLSEMHGHVTKLEPDVVLLSEMREPDLEPNVVAAGARSATSSRSATMETMLEPVVILALLSEMWEPKLEPNVILLAAGTAACRRRLRGWGHHLRGRRRQWRLMREAKLESDVALLSEMREAKPAAAAAARRQRAAVRPISEAGRGLANPWPLKRSSRREKRNSRNATQYTK